MKQCLQHSATLSPVLHNFVASTSSTVVSVTDTSADKWDFNKPLNCESVSSTLSYANSYLAQFLASTGLRCSLGY